MKNSSAAYMLDISNRLSVVKTSRARIKALQDIATELADICLEDRKQIPVIVIALGGLRSESASALAVLIFEQLSQNNIVVEQAFKDTLVKGR